MDTLKKLLVRFKALGVTLKEWAADSGVSMSIIEKISAGYRNNVTLETYEKLLASVERFERARLERARQEAA